MLIMLGSCYFFIYLPANEKTIQAQRFRALQNTDRNIHAKIENSIGLLNNLLNAYQNGDDEKKLALNRYIDGYSKTNFTLLKPTAIQSIAAACKGISINQAFCLNSTSLKPLTGLPMKPMRHMEFILTGIF